MSIDCPSCSYLFSGVRSSFYSPYLLHSRPPVKVDYSWVVWGNGCTGGGCLSNDIYAAFFRNWTTENIWATVDGLRVLYNTRLRRLSEAGGRCTTTTPQHQAEDTKRARKQSSLGDNISSTFWGECTCYQCLALIFGLCLSKNRKTSCHAGSLLIVFQWIWILKSDFCYLVGHHLISFIKMIKGIGWFLFIQFIIPFVFWASVTVCSFVSSWWLSLITVIASTLVASNSLWLRRWVPPLLFILIQWSKVLILQPMPSG